MLWVKPAHASNGNVSDSVKTVSGNKTEIKISYSNGKVKEIINLKAGKKHGKQQTFNNSGLLLSSIGYKKGLLCGDYLLYNGQGQLEQKKSYKCDTKRNKAWLAGAYLAYNGKNLISKGQYNDSLKNGKWYTYHNNGLLKEVANYKQGTFFGEFISYDNNGQILYKTSYIQSLENGKLKAVKHGKFVSYFSTGQLSATGEYAQGNKNGFWKEYNQNGELQKETFYKNGKIHGLNDRYSTQGKSENKGEFYEEIEVDGKLLKNVYHGTREQFDNSGKLIAIEKYNYGKKEGTWESYYPNGNIKESKSYINNLQTGKAFGKDIDGNKIYDASYVIIKADSLNVSVKTGPEMRWEKNILTFETSYEKGKENGLRKSYYNSGKLASINTVKDDLFQGETIEYYENGKVKNSKNYYSILTASNDKKFNQVGWSYRYSETGQLESKMFFDSTGTVAMSCNYSKGKLLQYTIAKTIELNYYPTGQLISEKIISQYTNMPLARYYYLNGNIRKICFQNAENLLFNTLNFKSDGKYHFANGSFYSKPDTLLPPQYTISTIIAAAGTKFIPNRFYTDSIKNGNYVLNYKNGKVFAKMNFKDDLPDGEFVFYHPETNDTMIYAKFKGGYLYGPWVEKFGGKNVKERGMFTNHKQSGTWTINQISGKAYELRKYNAKTGMHYATDEYYPSGLLKRSDNYQTQAFESRDENGNIISRFFIIDTLRKISLSENYYNNSNVLKSKSYYKNKIQDSIAEAYYPSGKLQSKLPYVYGKRNGIYKEWFENGDLKRQSNWENDKLEGMAIVVSDKGIDTMYYRNNNLQVKASALACACVDTTHSNARTGFAPLLNHLLKCKDLITYIPKSIVPVDSLNYSSIFYTGFQSSNGPNSGFTSLNLMLYKEFALNVPVNEQIKIIFNPCITKGYISRMEVSASYGIGNRDYTKVEFSPKRIALEFLKGPVKSGDKNYPHFKALFDTKYVESGNEIKLKITTKNPQNNCFTAVNLNGLIDINITQASPFIFEGASDLGFTKYNFKLSQSELEQFFGIIAQEATTSMQITTSKGNEILRGESDFLLLGGVYAGGAIKISCTVNKNEVYTSKADQIVFTSEDLRKVLKSKGFERINFLYNVANEELWFTFYTE